MTKKVTYKYTTFQPSPFEDLILLRRWRSDHSFMRLVLVKINAQNGILWDISHGKIPGLTSSASIRRLGLSEMTINIFLGFLISWGIYALSDPSNLIGCLGGLGLACVLYGAFLGASEWRRLGIFPFESIFKISPASDEDVARIMQRIGLVYAFYTKSLPLGILFGLSYFMSVETLALGFGLFVGTVATLIGTLIFAVAFVGGVRIRVALADRRIRQGPSFVRLGISLATKALAFAGAWTFVHFTFVVLVDSARSTFTSWEVMSQDATWDSYVTSVTGVLEMEISPISIWIQRMPWDKIQIISCAVVVLAAVLSQRIRPRLILTAQRSSPASRFGRLTQKLWVGSTRRLARPADMNTVMLIRRLEKGTWVTNQRIWSILFPTAESCFLLGATLAVAQGTQDSRLRTLIISVGLLMAIHSHTTEVRADLAPLMSVGVDRSVFPLLLQSPKKQGMQMAITARWLVLRALIVPASVALLVLALLILEITGEPSALEHVWIVAIWSATVFVAPLVQWYMGPLLIIESANERSSEHGLGAASDIIQSQFQGIVRYILVVLPCFVSIALVIVGGTRMLWAPSLVLSVIFGLHIIAYIVLVMILKHLSVKVSDQGLNSWRLR